MNQKSFLKKIYEILTPRERKQAALVFVASLVTAFAQAFGVASIFPFINTVMNPDTVEQNKWLSLIYQKLNFTGINSFIFFLGITVFLIVILSSAISAITTWGKARFTLGKNHALSLRLLTVYLSQPYEYFLHKNTSELGKNVLSEIYQLTNQLLISLFEIIINGLMVLAILVMLFIVDISMTMGVIFFLGGGYGLINYFVKRRLKEAGRERLETNRERYKIVNEALSGIKTTKVLGIESYFLRNYSNFSLKFTRYNVFAHVVREIPRYLLEAVAFGGIIFFILFMITRGEKATDFLPLLSLYAFAAYRTLPALNRLLAAAGNVYYNIAIADKIYEDMVAIKPLSQLAVPASPNKKFQLFFDKTIKLENISFSYGGSTFQVIKQINLTISKNNTIGFAGPTGCGKTTLVDIILGLLTPQKGRIIIDDVVLTNQNITVWQKKIGYVPQEIFLSDDTVLKNIAFGVPDKDISYEQVKFAARIAALDRFIEKELPQKYDTIIGERGIRLSGGQRQRIGLARALYRNPEVLILDEATSSLDGATEESVLKAIQAAAKARTVIMIAHRLNTLKGCNRIYILEKGRIIGQGTYEELLKKNERFRDMAKISHNREM